jgi:hypothetical protein
LRLSGQFSVSSVSVGGAVYFVNAQIDPPLTLRAPFIGGQDAGHFSAGFPHQVGHFHDRSRPVLHHQRHMQSAILQAGQGHQCAEQVALGDDTCHVPSGFVTGKLEIMCLSSISAVSSSV